MIFFKFSFFIKFFPLFFPLILIIHLQMISIVFE